MIKDGQVAAHVACDDGFTVDDGAGRRLCVEMGSGSSDG